MQHTNKSFAKSVVRSRLYARTRGSTIRSLPGRCPRDVPIPTMGILLHLQRRRVLVNKHTYNSTNYQDRKTCLSPRNVRDTHGWLCECECALKKSELHYHAAIKQAFILFTAHVPVHDQTKQLNRMFRVQRLGIRKHPSGGQLPMSRHTPYTAHLLPKCPT